MGDRRCGRRVMYGVGRLGVLVGSHFGKLGPGARIRLHLGPSIKLGHLALDRDSKDPTRAFHQNGPSIITGHLAPTQFFFYVFVLCCTTNFDSVSFCFEHRESNFEAHSVAKGASSLSVGRHVWLGIVPDIACITDVLNV